MLKPKDQKMISCLIKTGQKGTSFLFKFNLAENGGIQNPSDYRDLMCRSRSLRCAVPSPFGARFLKKNLKDSFF